MIEVRFFATLRDGRGKVTQIDIGQARQRVLTAESSLVTCQANLRSAQDRLKIALAIPLGTEIAVDAADLEKERAANEACRKQIDDLKDQVNTLELKGAFMSGGDSSSVAREKIDKLIREIDKCIALLEKD